MSHKGPQADQARKYITEHKIENLLQVSDVLSSLPLPPPPSHGDNAVDSIPRLNG
jgi:hypothetical protein